MMKKEATISIKVTTTLEGFDEKARQPDMAVYLFSRFGKPVAKQPIENDKEGKGLAKISFKRGSGQLLVKVGPDLDETQFHRLESMKPVKERVLALPEKEVSLDIAIPKLFWECWFLTPYIVKGSVFKSVYNGSYPVCYGDVEIYDVDPLRRCFLNLPERVIERIRDALIDLIIDPPFLSVMEKIFEFTPWPDTNDGVWCGRQSTPLALDRLEETGVMEAMKEDSAVLEALQALPLEWQFSKDRFTALSTARKRMNDRLLALGVMEKQAFLDSEQIEGLKLSKILYTNTEQFKHLIVEKFTVMRYWLCWWPWIYWIWWPWFWGYKLDRIGTAEIQPDGSFCKTLWIPVCRKDTPDLWFKVKQKINGVERFIYAMYPIPCHTYWNHPTNTSVTLTVTDEKAFACFPDPGENLDHGTPWVAFLSVGNYSLKKIYGSGAGNESGKIGLYENIGGDFKDGPFGGMLELRLLFSNALETMDPKPVRYYRIKYRVNKIGEWIPLTQEVVRHYSHYDSETKSLEFPVFPLGPESIGGENALFKIPPKDPPNKADEPDADWYVINLHADLPNAYLDSSAINGPVEFKLELFDDTGTRINPPAHGSGIPIYIPDNDDIFDTITMKDPALVNPDLLVDDPETAGTQAFILELSVENRKAQANIHEPEVRPSGGEMGNCGFIRYHTSATSIPPGNPDISLKLPFEARQQNNHAIYRFKVIRRTSLKFSLPDPVTNPRLPVGDMGPSGLFEPIVSLADLLAGCSQGEAAFSENLYIWHKAFNGHNRLSHLDASHVRSFALAPVKP